MYVRVPRDSECDSRAGECASVACCSAGSKSAARELEIGTTLAKAGCVCASVAYRLSAHDRWSTNLFDCKNAVRFLRTNAAKYSVDPE